MDEFHEIDLIYNFSYAIEKFIFGAVSKVIYYNGSELTYYIYPENQKIKKIFKEKYNLEYSKLLIKQTVINTYAKHIRFINKETINKITNYLDLNFSDYLLSIYHEFFKENPKYKSTNDHFITIDIYPFISDKNAYNIYLVPSIRCIIAYQLLNSNDKLYEIYQELVKKFLDENPDIVVIADENVDDKEYITFRHDIYEFLEKNIYDYKDEILKNVTCNEYKKIIEKLTEYVNNKIDQTIETIKLDDLINSTNNIVL